MMQLPVRGIRTGFQQAPVSSYRRGTIDKNFVAAPNFYRVKKTDDDPGTPTFSLLEYAAVMDAVLV